MEGGYCQNFFPSCRHTIGISYNCTTVTKTQNAHNFGHRHATDLYFTFLEMAEKVFLVKFLCHRRGSNPRLILVTIFCSLMLNDHGYILEEESHYLLPKTGGGARPICVSPPKRHVQSFPFPAHMKAEVMFT